MKRKKRFQPLGAWIAQEKRQLERMHSSRELTGSYGVRRPGLVVFLYDCLSKGTGGMMVGIG